MTAKRGYDPSSITAGVVSITPFTAAGELDEAGLRQHLQRLAKAKLSIWVGGSGSSEGYTLNNDELVRVIAIAAEELAGKSIVGAMGREPRTPAEMVEHVKRVQKLNVDMIQIYSLDPGHLYKPSAEEIESYLEEVLQYVERPAVLSAHTSVGYLPPIDVLERVCSRHDSIIGINISGCPVDYLRSAILRLGSRISVVSGGSSQTLDNLALGGNGYASSEANLTPQICASLVESYMRGDMSAMLSAYAKVVSLQQILMRYGYVTSVKAALNMLRLPAGPPRKPRHPLSADQSKLLREELKALEIEELSAL